MKAKLAHEPFSREGWLFEPKLDGVRCLVFRNGKDVELWSRNHQRINSRYPELEEALKQQTATSVVMDGEIAAVQNEVTSFGTLQQRMQVSEPSAELRRRTPVWFYAFDLPYLEDRDLWGADRHGYP
jgi:ATP-dependent DNA ligase